MSLALPLPSLFLRIVADGVRHAGFSAEDVDDYIDRNAASLAALSTQAVPPWTPPGAFDPVLAPADARPSIGVLPLLAYDKVIVGFSGGKDSAACVLAIWDELVELGVDPRERIELWHHVVDGRPGVDPNQFDWPCTDAYCAAFALAFGLPLYRSWREGGFLREMHRQQSATAPVAFETEGGQEIVVGGLGPPGTRGLFPQVSADLSVRWCSAYLKIMVASSVLANDARYRENVTLLMVTGERRQESPGRSRYPQTELHRAHAPSRGRVVHHHRPVLGWPEEQVWAALREHGVVPHPCYWLGFGRASCETCIFNGPAEWATLHDVHPERVDHFAALEAATGKTIHRERSIMERIARGDSKREDRPGASLSPVGLVRGYWRRQAVERFDAPILVAPETWCLPPGAFRGGAGPT